MFLGETPCDWSYSKKENEKQKVNCSIKIVRNLHQGGKLTNFKNEMKKNAVSVLGVSEVQQKAQGEIRSGDYTV